MRRLHVIEAIENARIGSSILIHYRERLAPQNRAVDGASEALFSEPSAIDWLDQAASKRQ